MGTVSKALSILDLFSRSRPSAGLSDLARLSGMNKATTYRLLSELQEMGYVEQVGSGREYRLGPAVLRLASLREAAVPMRDVARQVLRQLSDATSETAHISLLQGGKLITLSYAYSPVHGTRVTMEDAHELALHATSSGLAVLAFMDDTAQAEVLARPLAAHTPDTVTDPARLRHVLEEVRTRGYAESVGGFEVDVHSHAATIFNAEQTPIGAIAVAAPVGRMDPAQSRMIRQAVMASAADLTTRLGGFLPDSLNRSEVA